MTELRRFQIRYRTGTYTGSFTVEAENAEHALALVRARAERERALIDQIFGCDDTTQEGAGT